MGKAAAFFPDSRGGFPNPVVTVSRQNTTLASFAMRSYDRPLIMELADAYNNNFLAVAEIKLIDGALAYMSALKHLHEIGHTCSIRKRDDFLCVHEPSGLGIIVVDWSAVNAYTDDDRIKEIQSTVQVLIDLCIQHRDIAEILNSASVFTDTGWIPTVTTRKGHQGAISVGLRWIFSQALASNDPEYFDILYQHLEHWLSCLNRETLPDKPLFNDIDMATSNAINADLKWRLDPSNDASKIREEAVMTALAYAHDSVDVATINLLENARYSVNAWKLDDAIGIVDELLTHQLHPLERAIATRWRFALNVLSTSKVAKSQNRKSIRHNMMLILARLNHDWQADANTEKMTDDINFNNTKQMLDEICSQFIDIFDAVGALHQFQDEIEARRILMKTESEATVITNPENFPNLSQESVNYMHVVLPGANIVSSERNIPVPDPIPNPAPKPTFPRKKVLLVIGIITGIVVIFVTGMFVKQVLPLPVEPGITPQRTPTTSPYGEFTEFDVHFSDGIAKFHDGMVMLRVGDETEIVLHPKSGAALAGFPRLAGKYRLIDTDGNNRFEADFVSDVNDDIKLKISSPSAGEFTLQVDFAASYGIIPKNIQLRIIHVGSSPQLNIPSVSWINSGVLLTGTQSDLTQPTVGFDRISEGYPIALTLQELRREPGEMMIQDVIVTQNTPSLISLKMLPVTYEGGEIRSLPGFRIQPQKAGLYRLEIRDAFDTASLLGILVFAVGYERQTLEIPEKKIPQSRFTGENNLIVKFHSSQRHALCQGIQYSALTIESRQANGGQTRALLSAYVKKIDYDMVNRAIVIMSSNGIEAAPPISEDVCLDILVDNTIEGPLMISGPSQFHVYLGERERKIRSNTFHLVYFEVFVPDS